MSERFAVLLSGNTFFNRCPHRATNSSDENGIRSRSVVNRPSTYRTRRSFSEHERTRFDGVRRTFARLSTLQRTTPNNLYFLHSFLSPNILRISFVRLTSYLTFSQCFTDLRTLRCDFRYFWSSATNPSYTVVRRRAIKTRNSSRASDIYFPERSCARFRRSPSTFYRSPNARLTIL